jgi:hypothetical protein
MYSLGSKSKPMNSDKEAAEKGHLRLWHIVKWQPNSSLRGASAASRTATPSPSLALPLRTITRKPGWNPSYVDFESNEGVFQGAIAQGQQGAVFQSRSGDFAEWIRRKPGEAPFEAGDVVGFDQNGNLTRQTLHAVQVGVISRIAAVEGSVRARERALSGS